MLYPERDNICESESIIHLFEPEVITRISLRTDIAHEEKITSNLDFNPVLRNLTTKFLHTKPAPESTQHIKRKEN